MAYQYEELPDNNHFRILKLEPGKEDEPLQGTLATYALDDAPRYEALSYVWGSPEREKNMKCNDRNFKITDSLNTALMRLRLTDEPRHLWIDQICIDQMSIDERSQQVGIMTSIYSKAALVTAWLGPADPGEAAAVGMVISTLASIKSHLWDNLRFPENVRLQELGVPTRDSPAWGALNSMLNTPYFSRIWITQELAVAPTFNLLWGDLVISKVEFNSFKEAAIFLLMWDHDTPIELTEIAMDFTDDDWKDRQDLFQLVIATEGCCATDPRDKIFALVGLAGEKTYGIIPDYHKTEHEVFVEFATKVISETRRLKILNFSNVENPNDEERLPLWAPRWPSPHTFNDIARKNFKSSMDMEITSESTINDRILELKGIHVDTIKETCAQSILQHQSLMAVSSLVIDHEQLLINQYGLDIITPFVLTMMSGPFENYVLDASFARPQDNSYFDRFIGYSLTFLLASFTQNDIAENNQRALLRLIKMAVDSSASATQGEPTFKEIETLELFENKLDHLCSDDKEVVASYLELLKAISCDTQLRYEEFFKDTVHSRGRKFFITERGYIGRGPPSLEPGDSVCILFGGETPYIVRPRTVSSDEHLFLGQSYVHGIMDGEAIATWEQQRDSRDADFKERLFKLV
ncbi:hypothetical protein FLONG3_3915 [Fusarium longipes]|uniref:Heterokaryon incompatibility domain-containing protein n=1 Tax=Fusarium longipes TaxID=694270 RepID=A0A395SZU2_9HYPO|nr:hypothetical protein FLONG3_3915 [Fusarium longipes]